MMTPVNLESSRRGTLQAMPMRKWADEADAMHRMRTVRDPTLSARRPRRGLRQSCRKAEADIT